MMLLLLLNFLTFPSLTLQYNLTLNSTINDFAVINEHVYITTPTQTIVSSSELIPKKDYSKNFVASLMLYVDSSILFECGEKSGASDMCCYLKDSSSLTSIKESDNQALCSQFKVGRHHFPCFQDNQFFYLLASYYKAAESRAGAFSRMYFPNIKKNTIPDKLEMNDERINGLPSDARSQVVSPSMDQLGKYVVLKKSSSNQAALYFNPDINKSNLKYAELYCGGHNVDVVFGFALHPDISSHLTHYVLFLTGDPGDYRICSYEEETEMVPDSVGSLPDLKRDALFEQPFSNGEVSAFNGLTVNEGVTAYYAIGKDLFKIVKTQQDLTFRLLDKIFTATGKIEKIQFLSSKLGYVATNVSIESFVPHLCGQQTGCGSCTGDRDPHCGWCTLENRCTTKSECLVEPTLWTQQLDTCLVISLSDPSRDVMKDQTVELEARGITLPSTLTYSCVFSSGENTASTNGSYTDNALSCLVPPMKVLDRGLIDVNVSVYYREAPIGRVKLRYHTCNLYTRCGECSAISKFCTWCPLDGACSQTDNAICDQYKVTAADQCPLITDIQPRLISRDTIQERVLVTVQHLPHFMVSDVYQCQITSRIDPSVKLYFNIGADSTNSSLYCNNIQIDKTFPEFNVSESELDVSVIYRGGASGDSHGVEVVSSEISIFACGLLADDCVQCVGRYSIQQYSCRFCRGSCSYYSTMACENTTVIAGDSKQCLYQNTKITQIVPDWSPGEGGIPITFRGSSLAVSDQQISIQFLFTSREGVTTNVECLNSEIVNSTCLTCTTPNILSSLNMISLFDQEKSASVSITYLNSEITTHHSDKTFYFTPLDVDLVDPPFGPESGGTVITLNGTRLCVPDHTAVTVGESSCESLQCDLRTQIITCVTPSGTGDQNEVKVTLGGGSIVGAEWYQYGADPFVSGIFPNCTLKEGGINITVSGGNFNTIQRPLLLIDGVSYTKRDDDDVTKRSSDVTKRSIECSEGDVQMDPVKRGKEELVYSLPAEMDSSFSLRFKMDGVQSVCDTPRVMTVVEPPSLISSNLENNNTLECELGKACHINITMTQIHRFGDQVQVLVGSLACKNATVSMITKTTGQIGRFACVVPSLDEVRESLMDTVRGRPKRAVIGSQETDRFKVQVQIGLYTQPLGYIAFVEKGFQMMYVYIGGGVFTVFMLIFIVLVVKNRKDKRHMFDLEKKHQKEIDKVEASYAKAARQEFTELTLMTDHSSNIKIDPHDIPYRVFCDYLVHIMFPSVDKRKILSSLQQDSVEFPDHTLQEFKDLLLDSQFLVTFIDVIEKQRDFQVTQRCEVASYLTVALYNDFTYLSSILFALLDKLIASEAHKSPKLLLRATKSVAEKLLTNWLSLALYDYLCTMTGPSLYQLCYRILDTVEKGPLDFVTHQATYVLSQDRILSEEVEFTVIEVEGEGPDGTRAKSPVLLLSCDTITQAKGKLYRAVYKHQPYSQQPPLETLSLLWNPAQGQGPGNMELSDFDERMSEARGESKFNTLATYKVKSRDILKLTLFNDYHQAPMSTIRSCKRQTIADVPRYHLVKNISGEMDFRSPAVNKRSTVTSTKIASEAFLPTLIRTKEHLGKALEGLMTSVFMESNNIPASIKYLFDYLDGKTSVLGDPARVDPEIAHVWKTNSLPLRFWINIIKNPQFLFDIEKPPIMDSYLSVIGQCFMDSFSLATMTLNKDSSANKLVYNREVSIFRVKVDKWYKDVRQLPTCSLRNVVQDSKLPALPFRTKFAVSQLYRYALKYRAEIAAVLPQSPGSGICRGDFELITKQRTDV